MNNQFIQRVIFDWNRIDNDSYLKGIEAFKGIEKLNFNKPITFFVGENGSGKSTLLEALAVAHGFNPEGGTKNYVFSTHDTHSELCDAIRIAKGYRKEKWGYFLRAESFYNVATQEEEYADITHPSAKYHEKSHGESFLALAQNNMNPNGLYLFDEPDLLGLSVEHSNGEKAVTTDGGRHLIPVDINSRWYTCLHIPLRLPLLWAYKPEYDRSLFRRR